MSVHRIHKGLSLPLAGEPTQVIQATTRVSRVALVADDYPGLRPRMHVAEGDQVRRGQLLFEDRRLPGVRFTSPGAGKVVGVHRGERRVLQSVVVHLSDAEREGREDDAEHVAFSSFTGENAERLPRQQLVDLLVESGLWTALRARPFGKVPHPDTAPHALFVTAIDTHPLAVDPQVVVAEAGEDFRLGLHALSRLSGGATYLCVAEGSRIDGSGAPVQVEQFAGPHPAGLPSLHMHRLAPVRRERSAWYLDYQDVIAVGALCRTGRLPVDRIVSIAGPVVARPRLVRTRLGACLDDLVRDDHFEGEVRLISGSILSGKSARSDPFVYLGRYDRQLSILREHREREWLGWLAPGRKRFSILPVFLSKWLGSDVELNTSTRGSRRAMVPIGMYERVMPMDILPTFLLRALLSGDLERAEALGCLELDEEDLALCTFVCPSKIDYGPHLRKTLELLESGA